MPDLLKQAEKHLCESISDPKPSSSRVKAEQAHAAAAIVQAEAMQSIAETLKAMSDKNQPTGDERLYQLEGILENFTANLSQALSR